MKQRRSFIRKLAGLSALLTLPTIARSKDSPAVRKIAQPEGSFMHIVFFWLKDDTNATQKKFLTELQKFIDNVDLMKSKHIGSPADTNREVIDSTWSFSLVLSFKSKADHDLYQDHVLHKKFIENASALWTRVQVYDSVKIG